MTFDEYIHYFQAILDNPNPPHPYDNPAYFHYTELNHARTNRWMKTGQLLSDTIVTVEKITHRQNWIVITEPWCGDASHILPFIHKMSQLNKLIHVDYQLRDTEPMLINNYLTNGGKAIPILIVRDTDGNDLFHWGPRPAECQQLFYRLRDEKADFEKQKIELQNWYNADKGVKIQQEITSQLKRFL